MDSLPVQFLNNGFTQHNYNKLKSKIKSLIFLKLLFFPVSNFSKFSNDLNKKGINYRKINKCAVCFATLSFYCMRTQNRISFYTERSKTGEMVHFGKKGFIRPPLPSLMSAKCCFLRTEFMQMFILQSSHVPFVKELSSIFIVLFSVW